jgi:hypothetical protein
MALGAAGVGATVLGFGIIVAHVSAGGEHFEGTHQKLGLATFILMLLQPLNGLLRPAKAKHVEPISWARRAWEAGHKWFGRGLTAGACALVAMTGFAEMGRDGATQGVVSAGQAAWVLWCVASLGGAAAALEVARKHKRAEARVSGTCAGSGGVNVL